MQHVHGICGFSEARIMHMCIIMNVISVYPRSSMNFHETIGERKRMQEYLCTSYWYLLWACTSFDPNIFDYTASQVMPRNGAHGACVLHSFWYIPTFFQVKSTGIIELSYWIDGIWRQRRHMHSRYKGRAEVFISDTGNPVYICTCMERIGSGASLSKAIIMITPLLSMFRISCPDRVARRDKNPDNIHIWTTVRTQFGARHNACFHLQVTRMSITLSNR